MQYSLHLALCSGGAEDIFTETRLYVWERQAVLRERRTNWCTAKLPKMSSSGHCISTRVQKLCKLRAECRPVQDMKVVLPPRNQEGAFVQEVFWDALCHRKVLHPSWVFLMTVNIFMPCLGAWGHSLIGTVIRKESWEGNPARRTVKEMADRSAGGKPRGHTTQWSPSQQWGVTREEDGTPNTPTLLLLEQSHRETGSLQHREVLKLCPHPWLSTGQINTKVTLLTRLHRLGEAGIPLPMSIRRHSLSSVLSREADRVI